MDAKVLLDRKILFFDEPGPLHLMVALKPEEVTEISRKPIETVLVIDVSTSMEEPAIDAFGSSSKLALTKQAAKAFVSQLLPTDRVGLVSFSDYAHRQVKLGNLSSVHRQNLNHKIDALAVIGGTNLAEGAVSGLKELSLGKTEEDCTRRVILFTDGLPTSGITDQNEILEAIKAYLGANSITTIGFGAKVVMGNAGHGGYNPELLTSIATASDGNFYHAKDADGILSAFGDELGALRAVSATGVQVKIKLGNKMELKRVLNDCQVSTEDELIVVELGSLYSGETQYVVAEFEPPAVDKVFPRDVLLCSVTVTGFETGKGAFSDTKHALYRYGKKADADAEPNSAVEEQRVRLLAAKAIKEAYDKAAANDLVGAVGAIDRILQLAEKVKTEEGRAIANILRDVRKTVADKSRFVEQAAELSATSHGLHMRRSTGSVHSFIFRTADQKKATAVMVSVKPEDLVDPFADDELNPFKNIFKK